MRKTAIRFILMASIVALLITRITAAQEIGVVFDPDPKTEGFFIYTGVGDRYGWEYRSAINNHEYSHLVRALYAPDTPESLRQAVKVELCCCFGT
jgi:hypothetical protein